MLSTVPNVVLASTSPRRSDLLNQIGLTFSVVAPDYEEVIDQHANPSQLAVELAVGKAQSVTRHHQDSVSIGADTFVVFNGEIIGKPKSSDDAVNTLRKLRNAKNTVLTGWAVIHNGQIMSGVVSTDVWMTEMSDAEIDSYVGTGEPLDKAGCYAVSGKGAVFIDWIEGSIDATIGLPLGPVARALQHFGVPILD